MNFKKEFKKFVVNDFIKKYSECKTPNPCIECNRYLKFDAMYKKAQELGIEYIATGHYAKTEWSEKYNRYAVKKSNSVSKDQTYALYNVPKEIVDKIIFPLGEFKDKQEIREKAKEYNLNVADKPDSQEICFIPDNDYINFLENSRGRSGACQIAKLGYGNIVNTNGEILGKHKGLYRYTIGQRKGMGISSKEPLYVVKLDKEKNQLVVGTEDELYSKVLYAEDINLLLVDDITEKVKVDAKIRYSGEAVPAVIYPMENGMIKVEFDNPVRAITPGQSVVFYKDEYLLGRGEDKLKKFHNSINHASIAILNCNNMLIVSRFCINAVNFIPKP